MNGERDISERFLLGQASFQLGDSEPMSFDVYELDPSLPHSAKKREKCFEHITQGVAHELMNDFQLFGTRYPKEGEPQEITTQLSCKGVSCILKKCGLIIEQFDANGQVISEMKVVSS